MPTLLHIDTSPLGDRSVSRHLTAAYTEAWRTANPGATVVTRDLSKAAIPALDADWIQASYTPAGARTTKQQAALRLSDDLIAELKAADHSVFGVPMHNFSIPATLKLWIDQIARVEETFRYEESGPVGLITGKTATFIASSGGTYGPRGCLAVVELRRTVPARRIWFHRCYRRRFLNRRRSRCADVGRHRTRSLPQTAYRRHS